MTSGKQLKKEQIQKHKTIVKDMFNHNIPILRDNTKISPHIITTRNNEIFEVILYKSEFISYKLSKKETSDINHLNRKELYQHINNIFKHIYRLTLINRLILGEEILYLELGDIIKEILFMLYRQEININIRESLMFKSFDLPKYKI